MGKKLITAALPYANGEIHLGHIAGCYLNADIRARFERMIGSDVTFISGSDSYGVAILMKSFDENVSPQDIVNKYHEKNYKIMQSMEIEFDYFGSTLCKEHEPTVLEFFENLYNNNLIFEKEERQLYDEIRDEFLADRFIIGTCPYCKNDFARGDECSKCGAVYESVDLINPKSKIFGNPLIKKSAKHFYLKLSSLKQELLTILEHKKWDESVKDFVNRSVDDLQDRCITRSISWGVKVPDKFKSNNSNANVFYVWFDAPIGYISICKEYSNAINNPDLWKDLWYKKDTTIINFMGKDNLMFHSIMFPLMEYCSDTKLNIVDEIYSNEFLLLNENKFSKGDNNFISTDEIVRKYGVNATRFYLAANLPEDADYSFSENGLKICTKAILIGKICNFVNRVLVFYNNFISDKIVGGIDIDINDSFIRESKEYAESVKIAYATSRVRSAVSKISAYSDFLNKYFDTQKPWLLKNSKEEKDKLILTMNNCVYAVNVLSVLLYPITPSLSMSISEMIKDSSGLLKYNKDWTLAIDTYPESGNVFGDIKILQARID